MATEKPKAPEGFHNPSAYDGNETEFELEPGESMTALVLSINQFDKDWGPGWSLKLKREDDGEVGTFVAKGELKSLIRDDNLLEGDLVWIAKDVTEEEYNGSTYYPVMAMVPDGGDE